MMRNWILCVAGVPVLAIGLAGQNRTEDVFVMASPVAAAGVAGPNAMFHFIAAEGTSGAVVKNAPYSADSSSEITRVLADGTRIVNRSTAFVARDKEGRTRRENSIANIGPWASGDQQPPKIVTIMDPVAKEVLMLHVHDKTARKAKMGQPAQFFSRSSANGGKEVREERVAVMVREGGPDHTFNLPVPPPASAGIAVNLQRVDSKNAKTENLGRQNMEGVMVEGTRETVTVPVGEIGNDRPIVSVSERWYSPELQTVIMSKTNDPQFGETVYRVTNLRRNEPSPDLFKIPADYKVVENGPSPKRMEWHAEQK